MTRSHYRKAELKNHRGMRDGTDAEGIVLPYSRELLPVPQ